MRKFVLIFAAFTGEALIDADDRQKSIVDFPVVVSANDMEEAETIATRIAAMSGCRAIDVVPLAQRTGRRAGNGRMA